MSDLLGKSVVVTGSSSGLGEFTAILFAKRGCSVTLTGRDKSRLEQAAEKCKSAAKAAGHQDTKFLTVAGNIDEAETRERLLSETKREFGKIDVLVVNHGRGVNNDTFANITEEDYDAIMNTNLKSAVFLIQSAVKYLEETKGSIVCVSSTLTSSPTRGGLFAYTLSKSAMDFMIRSVAVEVGSKGIRINSINPGFIKETRFIRDTGHDDVIKQAVADSVRKATPLSDRFGVAPLEQQAEVISFLASDASRYISGVNIPVDGGAMCRGNPSNFPPCEDA